MAIVHHFYLILLVKTSPEARSDSKDRKIDFPFREETPSVAQSHFKGSWTPLEGVVHWGHYCKSLQWDTLGSSRICRGPDDHSWASPSPLQSHLSRCKPWGVWAFSHPESPFLMQKFSWNKNNPTYYTSHQRICCMCVYASMCGVRFVFLGLFYFVETNLIFSPFVKFYFPNLNSVLIVIQMVPVCV